MKKSRYNNQLFIDYIFAQLVARNKTKINLADNHNQLTDRIKQSYSNIWKIASKDNTLSQKETIIILDKYELMDLYSRMPHCGMYSKFQSFMRDSHYSELTFSNYDVNLNITMNDFAVKKLTSMMDEDPLLKSFVEAAASAF